VAIANSASDLTGGRLITSLVYGLLGIIAHARGAAAGVGDPHRRRLDDRQRQVLACSIVVAAPHVALGLVVAVSIP
jgi:hypothetical protein